MRCESKKGRFFFHVSAREHPLETVKFAAHILTGANFVQLSLEKGGVLVQVERKDAKDRGGARKLEALFKQELKDAELRAWVEDANRGIRERVIRLAIQGDSAPPVEPDAGLTDSQQKELDRIISEVEQELRQDAGAAKKEDPLGVTKTWEERYGREETKG